MEINLNETFALPRLPVCCTAPVCSDTEHLGGLLAVAHSGSIFVEALLHAWHCSRLMV